ncbi:MAG TPA: TonB family protein, partial [Allosphingosinicella sp.]
ESLDIFNVPRSPPPPPLATEPVRRPEAASAPEEQAGEAAPPRPRTESPPMTAPPRQSDVPPPVAAGIVPAEGGDIHPIGFDRPGAGTGSGGIGAGRGSGGAGTGTGGGGSGGATVRATLRGGRILAADYPRGANGHQGTVAVRISISAAGTVAGCAVTGSSGNQVLDATTCRLIRERFRFTPARDSAGNPIPDVKGWQQRWWRD